MNIELAQKQKLSNFEIIMELFEGKRKEEELTYHQEEYLKIIRAAYAMMLEVRSKTYIVNALMTQFHISQGKAYRMIREAGKVFATVSQIDKLIHQNIAIEMAMASFRMAMDSGDASAMTQATKAYYIATGLDKDDAELPVFEKLQPSLIINVLPEALQELLEKQLNQGLVDLNEMPTLDIEHEELSTGTESAD